MKTVNLENNFPKSPNEAIAWAIDAVREVFREEGSTLSQGDMEKIQQLLRTYIDTRIFDEVTKCLNRGE